METVKKVLLILASLIVIAGLIMLVKSGLNYEDGYSKSMLLDTAKQYALYIGIATVIILVYFGVKYAKNGVGKVIATSALVIIGTQIVILSITALSKIKVNRMFFPIALVAYITSLIALCAKFEKN